jgi:hypothetical protein
MRPTVIPESVAWHRPALPTDRYLRGCEKTGRAHLWVERGQIQVLNNRVIVHGRTPYQHAERPDDRRHLVRLWLRAGDRRHFRG